MGAGRLPPTYGVNCPKERRAVNAFQTRVAQAFSELLSLRAHIIDGARASISAMPGTAVWRAWRNRWRREAVTVRRHPNTSSSNLWRLTARTPSAAMSMSNGPLNSTRAHSRRPYLQLETHQVTHVNDNSVRCWRQCLVGSRDVVQRARHTPRETLWRGTPLPCLPTRPHRPGRVEFSRQKEVICVPGNVDTLHRCCHGGAKSYPIRLPLSGTQAACRGGAQLVGAMLEGCMPFV